MPSPQPIRAPGSPAKAPRSAWGTVVLVAYIAVLIVVVFGMFRVFGPLTLIALPLGVIAAFFATRDK